MNTRRHNDRSSHHPSPFTGSDVFHYEDYKASYDDLIDQYSSEYASTMSPPAPTGAAPSMQPPRRPSLPFTNSSYPTDFEAQNGTTAPSGKHVDWGYPPAAAPPAPVSVLGKWLPDSVPCRLFVLAVVLETIVDLAIEGELLIRFHEAGHDTEKMPVYLSIFAFAHVFQLLMAVDAVYARNTLQFICLTIFNALFLVYAVIQIGEVQNSLPSGTAGNSSISIGLLTKTIPCVISVAELAFIALGWKIYNEFGWKVYKFIGADRQMKKMYARYQVFLCIIKFDLFFFVAFCVQFIGLVLSRTDWEFYVTCAALPLSVVLLIEGYLAARHENKWMMITFMSGLVSALIYFVYKLLKVLINRTSADFDLVWQSLTIFAVISIILLVSTFIVACLVMANFGRGLSQQLEKNEKAAAHGRWGSQSASQAPMSSNRNRMSID